jgi:hypothetical protein
MITNSHSKPKINITTDERLSNEPSGDKGNQENQWYSVFIDHPTDWFLVLFNGLLVLFTYRLYVATSGLMNETAGLRNTADLQRDDFLRSVAAAQKAADAAQKSADVAEAALKELERPYLVPGRPELMMRQYGPPGMPPVQPAEYEVFIKTSVFNLGRMFANFKELTSEVIIGDLPAIPRFGGQERRSVIGHYPIGPNSPYEAPLYARIQRISRPQYEEIIKANLPVFYFGYIKYTDVFGYAHADGFCFRFGKMDSNGKFNCNIAGNRQYNYSRTEKIPPEGYENLPSQGAEITIPSEWQS